MKEESNHSADLTELTVEEIDAVSGGVSPLDAPAQEWMHWT